MKNNVNMSVCYDKFNNISSKFVTLSLDCTKEESSKLGSGIKKNITFPLCCNPPPPLPNRSTSIVWSGKSPFFLHGESSIHVCRV